MGLPSDEIIVMPANSGRLVALEPDTVHPIGPNQLGERRFFSMIS